MTDHSSIDFFDQDRSPQRYNSNSDEEAYYYHFSPQGDSKVQTKLSKFLKISDGITPKKFHPKHLQIKMNQKDNIKKRSSFRNNQSKELINDNDLILDPICERGLLSVLRGMKQKICKLGLSRPRASKGINLMLVKSSLKMRRKSDASKWSGGLSHLEQVTPFLVYGYEPAMTLQDVSYRHELISPVLRRSFDKSAIFKQKSERENNSPSTSASPSLSPERREQDSLAKFTVFSLVAPDNSVKSCHIKDTNVVYLEEEVKSDNEKIELGKFKELLGTVAIGNGKTNKTAVVLVNKEHIKEAVTSSNTPNSSLLARNGELRPDSKKAFEPISKTVIERKLSLTEKMKRQITAIIPKPDLKAKKSIFEKKDNSQSSMQMPVPPPLKANPNLGPLVKHKHFRGYSQDSSVVTGNFDSNTEDKKINKNRNMQTTSKKKLAEIVCPEKPLKTQNDMKKANQIVQPKVVASSFREPRLNVLENNAKQILIKDEKQTIQSYRASPSFWFNGPLIDQTYNNHNIKQVAVVAKTRKYRSPLAEELIPINKRKFVLEKTYGGSKPTSKIASKKSSVVVL